MRQHTSTGDFDLAFRPTSYFWPLGLETHLLATIKGAARKAELRRLIEAGRTSEIPDFLARSALSDAEREAIGRIHPAFMGGEYLPDLEDSEVEIARIVIASTTWDVTSVFARREPDGIGFRVVDEYNGDTLSGAFFEYLVDKAVPWEHFPSVQPRVYAVMAQPRREFKNKSFFVLACMTYEYLRRHFLDLGPLRRGNRTEHALMFAAATTSVFGKSR